ncbi:hypothetical protein FA10DRAFT_292053 [Acaromyces ingoldii]|uniref:Uncharacterized protein n=1 Tax=Acaromyces ingoldii TaxID=215250 RepID=A0A316YPC4_9BASI|nr:hypothetical protein FA10DRAFT_292053 [Acaromyces ingoldii]PWN91081.1 hypothetical protein FA10DRAFT_292053 [Acaromyces ingoldii]
MRVSAPLCLFFLFGLAALAQTASAVAMPASPAAWRVNDSPPLFAGELEGQEAVLKKRMNYDSRDGLPRFPYEEQHALNLRKEVHRLHKKLNRLSCSASTSHDTIASTSHDPSTSHGPSTSTSQNPRLTKLKHDLEKAEKKLRRELEKDHIKPLQDCLQDLEKNNNDWCNKCDQALTVVRSHLESPVCDAIERARQGDLSGPEEKRSGKRKYNVVIVIELTRTFGQLVAVVTVKVSPTLGKLMIVITVKITLNFGPLMIVITVKKSLILGELIDIVTVEVPLTLGKLIDVVTVEVPLTLGKLIDVVTVEVPLNLGDSLATTNPPTSNGTGTQTQAQTQTPVQTQAHVQTQSQSQTERRDQTLKCDEVFEDLSCIAVCSSDLAQKPTSIAAVPASPAAWRVSDSSPQEAGLKKRMDYDQWGGLPPPPNEEKDALNLRKKIHRLHKRLIRLSCGASTSNYPSTSTSQNTKLAELKHNLEEVEKKLRRELGKDHLNHLKPLQECLQGLEKNKNEWSNVCYQTLTVALNHRLESSVCDAIARARQGDLSGPKEQGLKSIVDQYVKMQRKQKRHHACRHFANHWIYDGPCIGEGSNKPWRCCSYCLRQDMYRNWNKYPSSDSDSNSDSDSDSSSSSSSSSDSDSDSD